MKRRLLLSVVQAAASVLCAADGEHEQSNAKQDKMQQTRRQQELICPNEISEIFQSQPSIIETQTFCETDTDCRSYVPDDGAPPCCLHPYCICASSMLDPPECVGSGSSPTAPPTPKPSMNPTSPPTLILTPEPSPNPTALPTTLPPTVPPTSEPSPNPTQPPTTLPPTALPTEPVATSVPTTPQPTLAEVSPTETPTSLPTMTTPLPTTLPPTRSPTLLPTLKPTPNPTPDPTGNPTRRPTPRPTNEVIITVSPSQSPPEGNDTRIPTDNPATLAPSPPIVAVLPSVELSRMSLFLRTSASPSKAMSLQKVLEKEPFIIMHEFLLSEYRKVLDEDQRVVDLQLFVENEQQVGNPIVLAYRLLGTVVFDASVTDLPSMMELNRITTDALESDDFVQELQRAEDPVLAQTMQVTVQFVEATIAPTGSPTASGSSGIEAWVIVLIVVGALVMISSTGLVYFRFRRKRAQGYGGVDSTPVENMRIPLGLLEQDAGLESERTTTRPIILEEEELRLDRDSSYDESDTPASPKVSNDIFRPPQSQASVDTGSGTFS